VILLETQVDGFGCLVRQRFQFGEGLTVIAGPNESGKTTLADCIVRLLFGYPEHQYGAALEFRKPWRTQSFAAALIYRLDDGRLLETRRDFGRSDVKTDTWERDTMRPVPDLTGTRRTSPGEELLRLSKEAYEAAAVMRAGEFTEKTDRKAYELLAERIAALVGSAGDAGAQAALDRLETFARELGSERAPARPVRQAQEKTESARRQLAAYKRDAARMRENFARRADLAARVATASESARDLDARMRASRLMQLRARIAEAESAEAALAKASASRTQSHPAPEALERAGPIEEAVDAWIDARAAEQDAAVSAQSQEGLRDAMLAQSSAAKAKVKEADAIVKRNNDAIERLTPEAGSAAVTTETLDHLEQLSDLADTQEAAARTKETQAAISRQRPRTGALPALFVFAIALVALVAGYVAHVAVLVGSALIGMLVAVGLFIYFLFLQTKRNAADRTLETSAQQARSVADAASANLAKSCAALGLSDIRAARRARQAQSDVAHYREAIDQAQALAERTREQVNTLEAAFVDFDRSDKRLVDARAKTGRCTDELSKLLDAARVPPGDLDKRIVAFREARHEMDGAVLAEKAIGDASSRLASALAGAASLEALRDEARTLAEKIDEKTLRRDGQADLGVLTRQLEQANETKYDAQLEIERIDGEMATYNRTYPGGGARLEEELGAREADEMRLTRARDAAQIARGVIEQAKDEVHRNFAPHLNALAGPALAEITDRRYTEVAVDPKDFALRVRAPENAATLEMTALSTGTREQLYLSLRAATAQALSTGDERVPLLLDDALAHADERRLAAAVGHLAKIAKRQQVLLFTQRDAVLEAARAIDGVKVVLLSGPAGAQP